MTNEDIIQQLNFRRSRINDLLSIEQHFADRRLLETELRYVDEQIDFRTKHADRVSKLNIVNIV